MNVYKRQKLGQAPGYQSKWPDYFALGFIFLLMILFVGTFSFLNIQKFKSFDPLCFGVGESGYVFQKVITQGQIFPSSYFAPPIAKYFVIFMPLFYLFSICYAAFPHPETLLICQVTIIASGALPIYLIAKRHLKSIILAIALSISYLLHPATNIAALIGFVPAVLGLPLLLFAFYYFEKREFKKYLIFIILANMAKIDMAIMTLLFGLCLLTMKKERRYGKATFLTSFLWLLITVSIFSFILKSSGENFPFEVLRLGEFGNSLQGVFQTILNNPFILIQRLFGKGNIVIFLFLISPGIISLFYPLFLLPIIIELGYILLRSDTSGLFLVLTFIYLTAIYGTKNLINLISNVSHRYSTYLKFNKNNLKIFFSGLILFYTIISHYYLPIPFLGPGSIGLIPLSKQFNPDLYKITDHDLIGYKFLSMIPRNTSCLAQSQLVQHLAHIKELGIFHIGPAEYPWEYIFLDASETRYIGMRPKDYYQKIKTILKNTTYGVLAYEDGWLLLKRGYPPHKNQDVLSLLRRFTNRSPSR